MSRVGGREGREAHIQNPPTCLGAMQFTIALALVSPAAAVLTASGFVPYYSYSGDLAVGGTVGPMTTR